MLVGHYSVAFALKSERNRIPLWLLFVAVQFLDYLWATFVLLGLEKLRIIPGFTVSSPLDSYYMPFSHGLPAVCAWAALAAFIYKAGWRPRASRAAALLVGLAVFSHWMLDLIAHPADLALYGNTWKVGFGFWNYRGLEFLLEIALLATGIVVYLVRNRLTKAGKRAVIAFGIGLTVVQIGDTYVPRSPLTADQTAMGVLVFYTLFVAIAFLVERMRPRPSGGN